jgi:hypothetical protein
MSRALAVSCQRLLCVAKAAALGTGRAPTRNLLPRSLRFINIRVRLTARREFTKNSQRLAFMSDGSGAGA